MVTYTFIVVVIDDAALFVLGARTRRAAVQLCKQFQTVIMLIVTHKYIGAGAVKFHES